MGNGRSGGWMVRRVSRIQVIPIMGAMGAVIASLSCELVINVYLFVFVVKKIHFQFPILEMFKSIMAACMMGGVLFILVSLPNNSPNTCILYSLIGIIIYFSILLVLRGKITINMVSFIKRKMKRT